MAAPDLIPDYRKHYGVSYLAHLRDGDDVTGRIKRVARRLALEQDRRDQELFAAFGGRGAVGARLLSKWNDSSRTLSDLTIAEERLMLMLAIETARTASLEIRFIDELVGHGVFAAAPIRRGDVIGEYTGVLRKSCPGDEANRYLANTQAYGRFTDFVIDGQDEGNVTRFINHSHVAPNVSNQHVFHQKRWHRILRADRDVAPGEQVLWNYGEAYWQNRERPADL